LKDFFEENKKGNNSPKLYLAASVLIKIEMRSIIMKSLNDYQKLFKYEDEIFDEFPVKDEDNRRYTSIHASNNLPRFIVNLDCQNKNIQFYPKLSEVKNIILYGIEFSTRTIEYLPDIESVIKMQEIERGVGNSEFFLPSSFKEVPIDLYESYINESQEKLSKNVDKCLNLVEKYLENYKDYEFIIKSDVSEICQEYFNKEHTFEEYLYVRIILKFFYFNFF